MLCRVIHCAGLLAAIALWAVAAPARGGDYRGMPAGWPTYANGSYPANYPANYGTGPAYYVARPVIMPSYASGAVPTLAYMPVTAAYSNPSYFAAYGAAPSANRPPVGVAAYYPPTTTAFYAPTTTNYAPSYSYSVSPAGLGSAGSEAATYYGQPTPLNYVPPRVAYRPAYAAVPVYMYRPVTAYDPVVAQPATCLQPASCAPCQAPRRSWFSWLHPHSWFGGSSCCGSGCGSPPPTTAYCTSGCPQPYYPTQPVTPVIPVVPAPTTTAPPTIVSPPTTVTPPLQGTPRIPPPGTRFPTTIQPSTTLPADRPPSLSPPPGGTFGPAPSGPFTPTPSAPIITPGPGGTTPVPGSFPTAPSTTPFGSGAAGSFGPSGNLPSGSNYPPSSDPYNNSSTSPSSSVFGSGYRGSSSALKNDASRPAAAESNVIRAPELGPALPPSVQTVPDPDAQQTPRPVNRAPSLLDPRDKSAARAQERWAVVPAIWPTKVAAGSQLSARPVLPTKSHESRTADTQSPAMSPRPDTNPAVYDDRGWKSAAGF